MEKGGRSPFFSISWRRWPRLWPGCRRTEARGLCRVRFFWYNNRKAVIIPGYGQGDTRAQPAAAPMADYTMPLRGHGIICAVQTAAPFAAAIWRLPLQNSGLRMLHHSQNQLCWFSCRFAAAKPERACRCGIITAKRLLYRVMARAIRGRGGARQQKGCVRTCRKIKIRPGRN